LIWAWISPKEASKVRLAEPVVLEAEAVLLVEEDIVKKMRTGEVNLTLGVDWRVGSQAK
jgi:hypothetical protein